MRKVSKWEEIKYIISLNRISITVAVVSIIYGVQLLVHPQILEQYAVYQLIHELFRSSWIGSVFIVLGAMKLYGVITNSTRAKLCSKTLLTFLYTLFAVAFKFSPPPNTVWIFALTMLSLTLMTSFRFQK